MKPVEASQSWGEGGRGSAAGGGLRQGLPSAAMMDVVLLSSEESRGLHPIAREDVPLCLRPLHWYAVHAWAAAGFRHFFLCGAPEVNKKIEMGSLQNLAVKVTYVDVTPEGAGADDEGEVPEELDTGVALRCYLAEKRRLAAAGDPRGTPRDVVVHSCETIVVGLDLSALVGRFYSTFASAALVLYDDQQRLPAERDCVALEDFESAPQVGADFVVARTHFLCSADALDDGKIELTAGFVARRPSVKFTTTYTDAHIYFLRRWVVDHVGADTSLVSLRNDLIPELARSQFPEVCASSGSAKLPGERLGTATEPLHWVLGGGISAQRRALRNNHRHRATACNTDDRSANSGLRGTGESGMESDPTAASAEASLGVLNAAWQSAPQGWDTVRLFSMVVPASPTVRLARISTLRDLLDVTKESLSSLDPRAAPTALGRVFRAISAVEHQARAALEPDEQDNIGKVITSAVQSYPPKGSVVANSVVGRNVTLGEESVVRNSIVFDACRIADGVKVENCIVCPGAAVTKDMAGVAVVEGGDFFDFQRR